MPDTAALGRMAATLSREARKRPVLSVALAAAGVGAVVVPAFGASPEAPEFRPAPVIASQAPVVTASAGAAQPGLAPFVAPSATAAGYPMPGTRLGTAGRRTGSPALVPPAGGRVVTAVPGASALPTRTAPAGARTPAMRKQARAGTPEKAASVSFSKPGEGETVTAATTVSGSAELPTDHQVWLLWRHGGGTAYHVVGACRGGRSFVCGPAGLESGGDETFQLTALVVDPAVARTLSAGASRDALPSHLARSEITVRRAAE
ncbi:hypothetical protein QLQ12_19480 [Actinoplanes sp. NEAU-A12]|uniref:Anti-sigma factor n=1 Tax=Actinoplanes sandaracinus TaxID=3045177 RepID=A0ABT6WM53_9ACTN|nr:hypothetical protein [Actinoplanes sandaracinus]MDI6100797.1 hypothetical protein [Actinoplanes sandaracinus]